MLEVKNNQTNFMDEEIDLKEVLESLRQGKWLISIIVTCFSAIALIYSLSLPNIYKSKALLVPVDSSSSISGALKNYSGLASLAGISLPSEGGDSNSLKAIKKLETLSFFENNILPNIRLSNLMAVKSWDHISNSIILDKKIYNENNNKWVRDFSYPKKQIPSSQESYEKFHKEHFSLNQDKTSGFITISIKHQSPNIAKKWVELVVDQINSFYRENDKEMAEKSVSYLNEQISKTNLSEIKQVMAELLQQEIQKLTLIEANEFYVFDFIDPPVAMEEKAEPSRFFICFIGAILGFFFGIVTVLVRHYISTNKDT